MAADDVASLEDMSDTQRVEAPVTWKTYLMCAFAAFGGVFFGYDSGYISGVLAMKFFIHLYTGKDYPTTDEESVSYTARSYTAQLTYIGRICYSYKPQVTHNFHSLSWNFYRGYPCR